MDVTVDGVGDAAGAARPGSTGLTREQLDTMVVEMIRCHAEGLLRLARQHSICADDANDAYQRGLEIYLQHAPRLDPARAHNWLRTVVKHEAMAVRKARQRDLGPAELQADAIEARNAPSPEEHVVGSDEVERSAEALQRCKPQEVRALWLRAQGNTYDEIQEITGWTRTKVNRCLYEGRQSFLARYAGIESGAECERWRPLLSSLVDGEASTDELLELRPHLRRCPSCRASVRELHRAQTPLGVVFPVAAIAVVTDGADPASQLFLRVYESVSAWLNERAAASLMRAQALIDGAAGSTVKATAVAATAATVAGGGAVAIDHTSRAEGQRARATPVERVVTTRKAPSADEQARQAAVRARAERERLAALRAAASPAPVAAARKPARTSKPARKKARSKAPTTASRTSSAPAISTPAATPSSPAPVVQQAGDLDLE